MELIYDNNSPLPTVRSQNFFRYSDKANLEHYENFCVLLSVLTNVSLFFTAYPEFWKVFSSIVMFQNVALEA